MISVSDILKLLDQMPIWKTLKDLPSRMESLERRIAALEAKPALPQVTQGQPCPACGTHALRRTKSEPSRSPFGVLGARDEEWTCQSCGEIDHRDAVR